MKEKTKTIIRAIVTPRVWHAYFLFVDYQKFLRKYYKNSNPRANNHEKEVIFMCDGKVQHGGLSDRLRGLISAYKVCKEAGIKFFVYFKYPFPIEDYLIPNHYDWRINADDISYNGRDSVPVFYIDVDEKKQDENFLKKKLQKISKKQVHLYINASYSWTNHTFGKYFHELFRFSDEFQQRIDACTKEIGCKYLGLTFRFMSLMGDFKDTVNNTLNEEEKKILLDKCIAELNKFKEKYPEYEKFLVTSDSITFLKEAVKLPFIYIVPGEVSHVDHVESGDFEKHLRTFLDFFMLSGADRCFCLHSGDMYKAGFTKSAAMVNDVPFEFYEF